MSLKKLSEELGLSQTTVSRALNGYPEVNEKTRSRVLQAAARSNYRPNQRAVSLATGRAMVVGHVIPTASRNDVVNPIFAEFIAGASQTYHEHGYELALTVASRDDEEKIYRNLSSKHAVDAFMVHSPLCDDHRVEFLNDIGIPFLVHGRVANCSEPYSWIDINNQNAFKQATDLLVDLGHRRIALINGEDTMTFAWHRRVGYLQALDEAGIGSDETIIFSSTLTETYGYETTRALIDSDDMPTAFLVSSYIVALGIRRALSEAGLRIRHDVSVIIHDDDLSYFDNGGSFPQFTSTRSSVREAGVLGASMLLDLIADPASGPQTHLLEAHLAIGSSTGPCPCKS